MGKLTSNLTLDREHLCKPTVYYLYRSHEIANDQPVVSSVYIRRQAIGHPPPEEVKLSLEWFAGETASG